MRTPRRQRIVTGLALFLTIMTHSAAQTGQADAIETRVQSLLAAMTLAEKIGQMRQWHVEAHTLPANLADEIRAGRVGSLLNTVDAEVVNELQRIAVEESRHGIPLLFARDVIHGFNTVMPIPLGLAATWNPEIVEQSARIAALEASAHGINWTFAPMIDVTRDPRWGRIAESPGEDPFLAGEMAKAMVRGFQGDDLSAPGTIAACAKHFAAYGASEAGRDYSSTNVPINELRNVFLPPFSAAIDAGVATIMTSFSDLDGIPATANRFLLRDVLRDDWAFDGVVVSDWDSVRQLKVHGLTENDRESALAAVGAGVDMEMQGDAYIGHLQALVENGSVDMATIDAAVGNILRLKFRLGLFERPYVSEAAGSSADQALAVAHQAALESVVLLKNDDAVLPISLSEITDIAVIGPLADAPYEQLGTWIFDGDPELSVTVLEGMRAAAGDGARITHVAALETSRDRSTAEFDKAVAAAAAADVAVLVLGEESILSGEAHSRADIGLPGAQAELVRRVRASGTPVVAVILAGRPLTLANVLEDIDALLYAWHPGTMAGPAVADLLFGAASPSGRLPVTFPKHVGQVPIYYNHRNTGKPPTPETTVLIDDIPVRAPQTSFGMTAFHLDVGYLPQFPFGFGLSYSEVEYAELELSAPEMRADGHIDVSVDVANAGDRDIVETVQLYIRDPAASLTRPVRELKAFQRVPLAAGERRRVTFQLTTDELGFYGSDGEFRAEPGRFQVWVGGDSRTELGGEFRLQAE